MLADNKLTDRSSWDDRLVAEHLKELSEIALTHEPLKDPAESLTLNSDIEKSRSETHSRTRTVLAG